MEKQYKRIDTNDISVLNINDRIRDIEDGDCYYEGIVTSIDIEANTFKYKCDRIVWNDEEISLDNKIGEITDNPQWWILEVEV